MLKKDFCALASSACSYKVKGISKILVAAILINMSCFNVKSIAEDTTPITTKDNAATLKEVQFVDGKYMDGDKEVFNVITMYDTENNPHYYLVTLNKSEYVQKSLTETYSSSKLYFNFEKAENNDHYLMTTSLTPSDNTISYEYKNEYGNKAADTSSQDKKYFKWDSTDGVLKLKSGDIDDYDLVYYVDNSRKANEKAINPTEVNKDYYNLSYKKDIKTIKTDSEQGGAIYNNNNTISGINSDFIGNHITTEGTIFEYNRYVSGGGAVANDVNGVIGDINGVFIQNYASTEDAKGGNIAGGAILNMGSVGKITGDFIGNHLLSNATTNNTFINGGAIANGVQTYYTPKEGTQITAQMNGIEGTFIGNYISSKIDALGGAISSAGTISGSIEGDFIGNHVNYSASNGRGNGGAIYNAGFITENIQGDFLGNYAKAEMEKGYSAEGGAIYNKEDGRIGGSIIGSFTGNYTDGNLKSKGIGGAVVNEGNIDGNVQAKFAGNYAISGGNSVFGGAVYNDGTIGLKDGKGNVTGGYITGDFIGNYIRQTKTDGGNYAEGGAIYNGGTIHSGIKGDFISNYAFGTGVDSQYHSTQGGAIYNEGTIGTQNVSGTGNIEGNFSGNSAISENVYAQGGAIYNYDSGIITGSIIGDYTNNTAKSTNYYVTGGAIHNENNIYGNIEGNYTGNGVSGTWARGGALYNYGLIGLDTSGTITDGNIKGNYTGNYANSTTYQATGGAIYNGYNIYGNIEGEYKDNVAYSTGKWAGGGAIYNNFKIYGNIKGNYTDNYAQSDRSYIQGGAIYNKDRILGGIEGNYSGNYGIAKGGSAEGGAIYNKGSILGSIEGNYSKNYVISDVDWVAGGAISNNGGTIGQIKNSSFYDNYAESKSGSDVYGGAIFSTSDLNIITDNGKTSEFKGNYTINGTVKDNNAIYMNGSNINLTANDNGKIIFHDNIRGKSSGYNVNLSSTDGTGEITFYDKLYNANITTNNVTTNFKYNNDTTDNYEIKSININENSTVNLSIDVDLNNDLSDTITVSNASSGIIYIDNINYISDSLEDKTIKILNADSSLKLALTDAILEKYDKGSVLVGSKEISKTILSITTEPSVDLKNVKWNEDINADIVYEVVTEDTYNKKGIKISDSGDSIIFNNKGDITVEQKTQNITETSKFDTLAYINQTSNGNNEKNFNFTSAEDTYTATSDIGTSSDGTLNINGVLGENNEKSTIDLNGKSGFELSGETVLNINNTELKNGKDNTLISVSNSAADINLSNVALNGNIVTTPDVTYDLNISGNTIISGSVGNANTTLQGENTVLSFGEDTFKDLSFNAESGTVSFVDGNTSNYEIGTLTSSENVKYTIDVVYSPDKVTADTITVGKNSSGSIIIDSINYKDGPRAGESVTVKVLDNTAGSTVSLAVSESLKNGKVLIGTEILSSNDEDISAAVESNVNWKDKTSDKIKTTEEVRETYADNSIEVSDTKDSLIITTNDISTEEKTNVYYEDVKTYDTLAYLNKEDKGAAEKSFSFDSANDVYTATEDMGTSAVNSILTLNGVSDEKGNKSTVDLNGNGGFELSKGSTLNVNNSGLKNGKDNTLIKVSDAGVNVNLANAKLEGNIASSTEYGLNITGDTKINGSLGKASVKLDNTNLALGSDNIFRDLNVNVASQSVLNYANNKTAPVQFGNLSLNSNLNLMLDANLAKKEMDTISVNSFNSNGNKINISKINILEPTTNKTFSISPIGEISDSAVKRELANAITYTGGEMVYSPIYKYNAVYDPQNGLLNFSLSGGNSSQNYNPAVMAAPIGAQMGGYLTQLNSYDEAFRNMDMYMLMTRSQRLIKKYANKYAITETNLPFVVGVKRDVIDAGGWFRPYATFESVGLKNGPSVNNTAYGTFAGWDSQMYELNEKWDGMFGVYAGYNGSHQSYQGNSIQQNGASLGLVGMLYRDNFFTGLTANFGASIADASTMYGNEDFAMIMSGVAVKTGYNKEFKEGRFIIQPSLTTSYSFVNTFDYTNGAGVRINADPLHAIHIEPGLKFIANLGNGWQPYLGVSGVWNIMDETKFSANNVSLPELSVKPYAKFGIGLRKIWGKRFTGYLQAFFTSGGRNGVGLQAGFKWTLGKSSDI